MKSTIMSIAPISKIVLALNHTKAAVKSVANKTAFMLFALAALSGGLAHAAGNDPFAQDTWHAVEGTWPGTMKFDGKSKKAVLTPVGAHPMGVSYAFTLKAGNKAVTTGTLKMTNREGQVSESTFRIEGKNLMLQFPGGQRVEKYVRLSEKEEEQAVQQLRKMILDGKTRPLK